MKYDISDLLYGLDLAGGGDEVDITRLRARVEAKLKAEQAKPDGRPKRRRLARTAVIAAACAAALGVTAIASALGGFGWLRETVDPEYIGLVEPVERSAACNGIKMTVIAAQEYGDMGVYYVSLQDTEGLGRVNENAVPFWFDKSGPRSEELVYYDAETQTAVYERRIDIQRGGFEQADYLALEALCYSTVELGDMRVGADLASAFVNGESVGEPYADTGGRVPEPGLTRGRAADIPGSGGAYVSAFGSNCGFFAVQVCWPDSERYYSILPYLLTEDGERIDMRFQLYTVEPQGDGYSLSEFMFDADAETLSRCELHFEGYYSELVKGGWRVDLELGDAPELKRLTAELGGAGEVEIIVSPLGVSMRGRYGALRDALEDEELSLEAGEGRIELGAAATGISDGVSADQLFWHAPETIDPNAVSALTVAGERIEL